MLVQSQVGPIATNQSITPGTQVPQRSGQLGDVIVSELQPRYYEQGYRRNIFTVANQAAVTTTAALATNYTGLVLQNPVGSTINIVVLKCGYGFTATEPSTAATVGLMCGYSAVANCTHGGAITPVSVFYGSSSQAQAKVDNASNTVSATPVVTHIFGSCSTGNINTQIIHSASIVDLDGSLILPPGAFCAFYTLVASGAGCFFSFTWEEVPT